jgi:hypothetical protein
LKGQVVEQYFTHQVIFWQPIKQAIQILSVTKIIAVV